MISKIFGTKKAVDAGINAIDAIVHTEEEKSKAQQVFLKLYEPFKLAQRVLAAILVPPYALAWITTFFSSFWIDPKTQYLILEGRMGDIVALVVAFYFGGGAAESIFKFLTKRTTVGGKK